MPLYDYACPNCALVAEQFFKMAAKPDQLPCPACGAAMRQRPGCGAVRGNEAAWLPSVTAVVDKQGGPHCQRFLAEPNRDNYRRWLAGEGLRPLEPGEEGRRRPDKSAQKKAAAEQAMQRLQEARRITVKTP